MPGRSKPPPRSVPLARWQHRLHVIIFEADTFGGKLFDVALLLAILISVTVVLLDSVAGIRSEWGSYLLAAEWTFTILFTIEYILRLMCVGRPWRYAMSFYGIVDLLAIIPTYLSIFVAGSQSLIVIRALRLIRVFRVLELSQFLLEGQVLWRALRATGKRIVVFLLAVMAIILIMGSTMYVIEGGRENTEITSIPKGVYWAIVTVTTVGYGDVTPKTELGRVVAAIAMLLGYSIIIVPGGIFTAELIGAAKTQVSTQACEQCGREGHDVDAAFCKFCGSPMD